MREKTVKTVLTFATTSDAMAFEAAAREHAIPGRIIPVPSDISAGCGLAWCADAADRETLLRSARSHALAFEGAFQTLLY